MLTDIEEMKDLSNRQDAKCRSCLGTYVVHRELIATSLFLIFYNERNSLTDFPLQLTLPYAHDNHHMALDYSLACGHKIGVK